jgi:LPXTG-motif cell wall-anchored protein
LLVVGIITTLHLTVSFHYRSFGEEAEFLATGAIAGGVVGGVLGLALIAGLLFFFLRKRRRDHRDDFDDGMVCQIFALNWKSY